MGAKRTCRAWPGQRRRIRSFAREHAGLWCRVGTYGQTIVSFPLWEWAEVRGKSRWWNRETGWEPTDGAEYVAKRDKEKL